MIRIQKWTVNTWDDWHILAESRPVFAPPEPKTNYIDVPGGNGSLDLSELLRVTQRTITVPVHLNLRL